MQYVKHQLKCHYRFYDKDFGCVIGRPCIMLEFYDQHAIRAVNILGLKYIKKNLALINKRTGIGQKGLIKKAIQNGYMAVVIQQQEQLLSNTKKRKVSDIDI